MYEEDNRGRNTILAILGVVFALALVGIFIFKARKPEAVATPKAYRPYIASDKAFACSVPNDWKRVETGGMGIMSGVDVHKASANISILSDLQGSLMGDVAHATNAQMDSLQDSLPANMRVPMPKTRPAVEQLHDSSKGAVANKVEQYKEKPMLTFQSPMGDARLSEWTGEVKGFLGSTTPVHGYRATILGGERRITVVEQCNESDWAALQKPFQIVIGSLKNGGS